MERRQEKGTMTEITQCYWTKDSSHCGIELVSVYETPDMCGGKLNGAYRIVSPRSLIMNFTVWEGTSGFFLI